jgi:hypothetical protein
MQESNIQALGTLARLLVNQTNALLADLSQPLGDTILYTEGYVVNALIALIEPLLDSALG